ncbi:Outer membrane efflux protein [Anaerovirgula multivorans]|uniref:Outer membrane efflux protein n=1 Tax=Anaerovirgula multivorans TaxID=312168 RepID=A0A239GJQ0_9FIRM|nr:TolC family protein [Anaerovirgula multivorans]SNS68723.1 Outer membrane efflux protein [Anaerovirgula multivorans]
MINKIKTVAVVFIFVMITTTSISAITSDAAEEKTFTLQQAINYATENSPLISISNTAIEKAKVSFREAKGAYKESEDSPTGAFESQLLKDGYYKRMAEKALKLAEKGKVQTTKFIKFMVEKNYFNLLNARENVNIQNSILELAEENLDIAKKKYDLGIISELELISFENSLAQTEVDLRSAQRASEYEQMNFNKALALPLQTKIKLTDVVEVNAPEDIDIEKKVSAALQNRMEIISAREQYEVDKLYFDITAKWYPSITYKHQSAKHALESSEYNYINIPIC